MLREQIAGSLKSAMKDRDEIAVATLRLILAALKDRDIAARAKGSDDEISNDDILPMLQTMVKQRRESIELYEKGGRLELAERELAEIGIIQRFLPKQLADEEIRTVVEQTIAEIGAASLKDLGRVMTALRDSYAGQMDFGKASGIVKTQLGAP